MTVSPTALRGPLSVRMVDRRADGNFCFER
jgi:hypothetical protein